MSDAPTPDTVTGNSPGALAPPGADPLLEKLRAATLGEYDIYGELGRGGMASVYLAHELALDRKVAIKVMSPLLLYGPGMTERFKREARTAAHLSHPNIIPIYAVREAGELLFFVMKLVEGTPLDSIMKELGKLPIPMVEAILAQVGGAFGYAHRRGVIHRDIKPSNILIDDEGWAVVTDFGIAKVQESESLTLTGSAMGTPTYMSPEQCEGKALDGSSDQYSLGVVAYEMLTGRPPFVGSTMALLYSHGHEAVPPISLERPDCPESLQTAVLRMLAKDPAARWPSMEEAVAALGARQLAHDDPTRSQLILLARSGTTHKIVSQVQTPRSPIPLGRPGATTPRPEPLGSRKRSAWLLAGAAALAVVAAVLLLLPRPPAPEPATGDLPGLAAPPTGLPAPGDRPGGPPVHPDSAVTQRAGPPPAAKPPVTRPVTTAARPDTATRQTAVTPPPSPSPAPSPAPAPAPAPAPTPAPSPAPAPAPPPAALLPVPEPSAPGPVRDERVEVTNVILAYARALEAGDLSQALRLYPGMPPDQRQGLEAFWKSGGTMRTRWTVSEVTVGPDAATARVQGTNSVSSPRSPATEQRVSLRARLERRGTEWRLVALVN